MTDSLIDNLEDAINEAITRNQGPRQAARDCLAIVSKHYGSEGRRHPISEDIPRLSGVSDGSDKPGTMPTSEVQGFAPAQTSEIWDVELREKFLTLLKPIISDEAVLGMMANALSAVAKKHYNKPVSVSLEKCARAIEPYTARALHPMDKNNEKLYEDNRREAAKAVLDAAGVAWHE